MAYACALMFVLPGYTTAVLVGSVSATADTMRGVGPRKTAFNAAMMAMTIAAGQLVLHLGGADRLLDDPAAGLTIPLTIVLSCAVMFVVNGLLMTLLMSLVTHDDVSTVLRRDFWTTLPTDGILLPLGPVMVVVGAQHLLLLPFAMLLTFVVYQSAKYAAERERDATHDHLTGLPNRRLFETHVEQALDRTSRTGRRAAVLLLDLNGFKAINDIHGHQVGDEVLREVAGRLSQLSEESMVVSRLGGDEFAVLISPLESLESAELTAIEIARLLDRPIAPTPAHGAEFHVSASVGIAVTGPGVGSISELIREADAAMYQAKRHGLGHAVAHEDGAGGDPYAELDRAINEGELFCVYEPLLDARTEAVMGFEALVRWDRPGHGVVPPAQFIPFAEASPLIAPLTRWVLDDVLGHLRRLHDQGHRVGISVNVSARNLSDPGFLAEVLGLLDTHGVTPSALTLEITETALMRDTTRSLQTMTGLAEAGIRLALDDFGAGHSSLAKLRDLPVSVLKIDRSFLEDADTERGRTLLRTFIDLAASFGMASTAEGVQSRQDMALMAAMGCDLIQGHVISLPLRGPESAAWLAGRASIDTAAQPHVIDIAAVTAEGAASA